MSAHTPVPPRAPRAASRRVTANMIGSQRPATAWHRALARRSVATPRRSASSITEKCLPPWSRKPVSRRRSAATAATVRRSYPPSTARDARRNKRPVLVRASTAKPSPTAANTSETHHASAKGPRLAMSWRPAATNRSGSTSVAPPRAPRAATRHRSPWSRSSPGGGQRSMAGRAPGSLLTGARSSLIATAPSGDRARSRRRRSTARRAPPSGSGRTTPRCGGGSRAGSSSGAGRGPHPDRPGR